MGKKKSSSLESYEKYASVTLSKLSVYITVLILYVGKLYTEIKIQPPLKIEYVPTSPHIFRT